MPEHPDLNRFRQRVQESSENHRSTVTPQTNEIHRDHVQGRMTSDERRRVEDQAAAEIRRAMGNA